MLGAGFDEALLRAVATERGTCEMALERLVEADLIQRPGTARDGRRATDSRTRSCTRWSTRTCCCAPHRAARARRPRARARRRPAPGAAERPRSARPPLEPQRRTSPRARATWWRPATGRARSTPTTMRSATTSARCARSPSCRACDDQVRVGARAARRSAGAHRAAGRGARALRGRAAGARGGGRSRRRRAPAIARSADCIGKPATASAPAPASRGPRAARRRRRPDRARAPVPGDGPARVSRRRQCRRHRVGRAGARRGGEREEAAPPTPSARARPRPRARRPTTRSGVALARTGRLAEAVDADRAEHRAGRGARSAAGGLPRLHEPRRALQLARSAPQHRDLPARARDREEGRRSRLPVAALCQPGGGLLRADRSLRGGRHRGGANGHRPRPPAGPARSSGGAADRARARSTSATATMPWPSPPTRRRSAWPSRSASRSSSSPATMAWRRLYLDAGDQALAEVYLAKAQEVCERAGVEPDALMVLPFLC